MNLKSKLRLKISAIGFVVFYVCYGTYLLVAKDIALRIVVAEIGSQLLILSVGFLLSVIIILILGYFMRQSDK